ncbi:MAG: hypothetical protein GXX85_00700 [Ignavibacteria bacterium]|nr:hypothetical protein [Ignavibacteria bacterium]
MKKILFLLLVSFVTMFIGCSDDSNPAGSTGMGGTGGTGGTGNVTFVMGQRVEGNGVMFTVKPSVAITVTQYTCSLPAQNFTETYQGDGVTVYPANQVQDFAGFTGVQAGQQWTFNIQGKIGNAQGAAYNVNVNYTAQ